MRQLIANKSGGNEPEPGARRARFPWARPATAGIRRLLALGLPMLLPLLARAQNAPGQGASPRLVQWAGHNNGAADLPFCSASFPSNNTAGNLIVVAVE